jgi:hypothetical protein
LLCFVGRALVAKAHDAAPPGVYGESAHWQGVAGVSHSAGAGVNGYNDATAVSGQGVWAESLEVIFR